MAERNRSVDIIRGLAMLMVVLGHTISGSSIDFEQTFIFQVIWTLQMPLFMLISGYVTRYSKQISNSNGLLKFVRKRTLAYMLPWIVWTLLIRGIVFGESKYTDLGFILWNMDCGYWFLATIWTISLFFGFTEFVVNKISCSHKKQMYKISLQIIGCIISMIIIGLIGLKLGLNFFAIKLTLYYFPFYIIGYLYGQLQEKIKTSSINKYIVVLTGICLLVWIYLINRVDFYSGKDDPGFIILRFLTSLIGSISITSLVTNNCNFLMGGGRESRNLFTKYICVPLSLFKYNSSSHTTDIFQSIGLNSCIDKLCDHSIYRKHNHTSLSEQSVSKSIVVLQDINHWVALFLNWIGLNSIAIYLLHGFFLCQLKYTPLLPLSIYKATLFVGINYIVTVACCGLTIRILQKNKFLNKLLFWK